jgi:colanic acid biosynthesis glycosyl transferase WcaI
MKILMVTQWWPPEPAGLVDSLGHPLASRGHEVHVITGYPSYPSGRLYPGYRQRWRSRSRYGDLAVTRVPLYPSHDRSTFGRVLNYLSFGISSALIGTLTAPRPELVYIYHPPITSALSGLVARFARRAPYVLHIQDMWPESVVNSGMVPSGRAGRIVAWILSKVCMTAYRGAAMIVVISPGMKSLLVERGVDPSKITVIYNWCDESTLGPTEPDPKFRTNIGWDDRVVVLYAGNFGDYQGLDAAVYAAAALADTTNLQLVLVGSGIAYEKIRALVEELGATNVSIIDRVEPAAMRALNAVADFMLVSPIDLPFFSPTIPGKSQVALASGKPVIMAVRGDAADLILSEEAGIVCEPNVEGLREAFRQAASLPPTERIAMGERARYLYVERLSLRRATEQFEEILERAFKSTRTHG